MREIEFRGKDQTGIMNHSWFYGSLDLTFNSEFPIILCKDRFNNNMSIHVDKNTVGQYTGLKDKNGTKIFEGDIFEEVENETRGVVVFENGAFKIRWYGIQTVLKEYGYDDGGWGEIETESFDMYYVDKMEVIGNIHDNPELLEG